MASDPSIQITVLYSSKSRHVNEVVFDMKTPCTVLDAIKNSDYFHGFAETHVLSICVGVWGRKVELHHVLRDKDRVEIYRPLKVDPKVARRERFVKQGAKTSGLFLKKRAGAKAGY